MTEAFVLDVWGVLGVAIFLGDAFLISVFLISVFLTSVFLVERVGRVAAAVGLELFAGGSTADLRLRVFGFLVSEASVVLA